MAMFYRLNEQQYARMILNEEMHYPKFLDKLKGDVFVEVFTKIMQLISQKREEGLFSIKVNCDWVNTICVVIKLIPSEDIKTWPSNVATYFNNKDILVDGKLDNPSISITIPCDGKDVNYDALETSLCHELTHLYDDWVSITNGNGCICANITNVDTEKFIGANLKKDKDKALTRSLAFLAYMSLKTERQAFASQTLRELIGLGFELRNYKDVMKKSSFFKNMNESFKEAMDGLENCKDADLVILNRRIMTLYPNANIPKIKAQEFIPEEYRRKLVRWAEKVYHDGMKVYGGVVQYYLNKLEEENLKKYGPPKDLWRYL